MICPYCQHDLDVQQLACPRCHAEYPHAPRPFGFSLRAGIAVTALFFVASLVLVDCVLNYLPGGPNSLLPNGSAQLPIQPLPDSKSAAVDNLLNQWRQGQQANPLPGFIHKH